MNYRGLPGHSDIPISKLYCTDIYIQHHSTSGLSHLVLFKPHGPSSCLVFQLVVLTQNTCQLFHLITSNDMTAPDRLV